MQIDYNVAPPRRSRGGYAPRSVADRFWEKVNKNGPIVRPDLGPCWLWTGGTRGGGYGELFICRREDGTSLIEEAHVVSWVLHYGPMPEGATDLCHKCDNKPCVHPEHLFPGTRADNMQDAKRKGRLRLTPNNYFVRTPQRGSNNLAAKLTDEQVRDIRRRYAAGERSVVLAAAFGIGRQHVWQLVTHKRWPDQMKAT